MAWNVPEAASGDQIWNEIAAQVINNILGVPLDNGPWVWGAREFYSGSKDYFCLAGPICQFFFFSLAGCGITPFALL